MQDCLVSVHLSDDGPLVTYQDTRVNSVGHHVTT
jgi:hypothetical protein